MNVVIASNRVYTIVAAQICPANSQVIHFDVQHKIEDNVELWTVNQDQVVNSGVGW